MRRLPNWDSFVNLKTLFHQLLIDMPYMHGGKAPTVSVRTKHLPRCTEEKPAKIPSPSILSIPLKKMASEKKPIKFQK